MANKVLVNYFPITDIRTDNPTDISIPTPKQEYVEYEVVGDSVSIKLSDKQLVLSLSFIEEVYKQCNH